MRSLRQMLHYAWHFEETPESGVRKRKTVKVSLLLVVVLLQERHKSSFSHAAQGIRLLNSKDIFDWVQSLVLVDVKFIVMIILYSVTIVST